MVCCTGCAEKNKEKITAETSFLGVEQPVQESWNISLNIFRENRIHITVTAGQYAEFSKNDSLIRRLGEGITVIFFDDDGNPSSTLTADKGTIYDNHDMEAYDNVVLTSEDSTIVRTDYIKRLKKEKKLWSDSYVVIQKPGETIKGYGFESDESLKNYTIFRASGEAIAPEQ